MSLPASIAVKGRRLLLRGVVRRRGINAVGRYGTGVASRWLGSMGLQLDRHHVFTGKGVPSSHPDFFDHSTPIACEVETGRQSLTNKSPSQIAACEFAEAWQTRLVACMNVAFEGRLGRAPRFREEPRKGGFPLVRSTLNQVCPTIPTRDRLINMALIYAT